MSADNLAGLSIAHLRQIKAALQEQRRESAEIAGDVQSLDSSEFKKLFGSDFSWAWVYELSITQHLGLLYVALGLHEAIKSALAGAADKNQAFIEFANRYEPDEKVMRATFGGSGDDPRTGLALALVFALLKQLECLEKEGCFLSDLVRKVNEGDVGDVAFARALQIDRTTISCETFAARITRAELEDDSTLFRLLANKLKKRYERKSPKQSDSHKDLRVMLYATHEAGMLSAMSMRDVDKLFIEELAVYSDDGEDPARGLQRFILRWKNNR